MITPVFDKILIKPVVNEEVSTGGIIFGSLEKKPQDIAEIIAVGPGKKLEDGSFRTIPLSVGDKILYTNDAGFAFTVKSEKFRMISEVDALAIID